MAVTERDVRLYSVAILIVLLSVLTFLVVKPVLLSVIGGLILAYALMPVYKKILRLVKYKNLAAALVSVIVLAIIIVPLWIFAPVVIHESFQFFQISKSIDLTNFISSILPNSSPRVQSQLAAAISNAFSEVSSLIVNSLVGFLLDFAVVFVHIFVIAFVFFFALRDSSKLKEFVSGLSPINKSKEVILVKQFKDITQSIIYGQIVVGLIQGILAGVGLLLFGVPNALILTVIATMLSIIPLIGPGILYLPITIYLIINGNPWVAVGYLTYNLIIVSSLDNFIRAHLVARKSKISPVIALIGMIGGLFIFGILGLILGPLILAYFITFLREYKERSLISFFSTSN